MATPEIPAEVLAKAQQLHATVCGCNGVDKAVAYTWGEAWDACTSVYEALIEYSVEKQTDVYWDGVYELLGDETSQLWQAFGRLVEKLAPGIGPWDKRQLVASIVSEFKKVVEDVD